MTSLQCLKPYISIEFRLPSHRYIYTNIKMVPLKLHQSSTWRIQGCVLSIVHSWESVSFALWGHSKEILSAFLALCEGNYRWIPLTKDQWCGTLMFPLVSVWKKLLNKQYMSRWFDMYWSLFDVALMIYNKIWMNISHEIYMNPWLAINFSRLYQKRDKCWK